MMRSVIYGILVMLFSIGQSVAQVADTIVEPEVFYSDPKTYKIGGIDVTGIGEQYDPATLIQLSGLKIGNEIQVPGDAITKAI